MQIVAAPDVMLAHKDLRDGPLAAARDHLGTPLRLRLDVDFLEIHLLASQ